MLRIAAFLPGLLVVSLLQFAQAHADEWAIVEVKTKFLGTLGGANSFAHDINDRGEIVGWSDTAEGIEHAFVLRGGGMEDLGDQLGLIPTRAHGINDHGEVVGVLFYASHGLYTDSMFGTLAAYWSPEGIFKGLQEQAAISYGDLHASVAYDINDKGGIAGALCCVWGNSNMSVWWTDSNTAPLMVAYSQSSSIAFDINDTDKLVGRRSIFAYRHDPWGTVDLPKPVVNATNTTAQGINKSNEVVGHFQAPSEDHAQRGFYWDGVSEHTVSLGVLPTGHESAAYAINDLGFVAGWADRVGRSQTSSTRAAIVWHEDFGMVALPTPPSSLPYELVHNCEARGIANRTARNLVRLVGACTVLGTTRAVLWEVKVKSVPDIGIGPAP